MANDVLRWSPIIKQAARKYGIPASILAAQIQLESGGKEGLTSSAGAQGLTQFMPGTAKSYGVNVAPGHAKSQIFGAAHYLSDLGFNKDRRKAIASYAAGPGNYQAGLSYADKLLAAARQYTGLDSGAAPAPVSPTKKARKVTQTIPGVDRSGERAQLIAEYLSNQHNPNALIELAVGLPQTKDTPARKITKTTQAPQSSSGKPSKGFVPGGPVPGQGFHATTHETAGLPGYPAYDYMAPAGTAALAPVTGTVVKLSGHDPSGGPTNGPHGPFGWSVYIKGSDGRMYYMTHMGSRNVAVGQRVRAGQKIGTVGDYAKWGGADHIHMGVHG